MRTLFLAGALCTLSMTLACSDSGGGSGGPVEQPDVTIRGGLGRTSFTYACTAPGDSQCNLDADLAPIRDGESPFPALAVGSRFGLEAKSEDSTFGNLAVDVVSSEYLEKDGSAFVAKRPGIISVVATENAVPIDFANIELVAPAKFKILQAKPDGDFRGIDVDFSGNGVSVTEDQQFTFKFRAVVLDQKDTILAGALPCTWTTSDESIARITSDPASNIVTLVSGRAGTATVEVTYGAFNGTVTLQVNP